MAKLNKKMKLECFSVDLSIEEAYSLYALLMITGGMPDDSIRKFLNPILKELQSVFGEANNSRWFSENTFINAKQLISFNEFNSIVEKYKNG